MAEGAARGVEGDADKIGLFGVQHVVERIDKAVNGRGVLSLRVNARRAYEGIIGTIDECVCVEQIERFHACSCLFCSQKYINTLVNTAFFVLLYPKSPLGLTS